MKVSELLGRRCRGLGSTGDFGVLGFSCFNYLRGFRALYPRRLQDYKLSAFTTAISASERS